jgi:two-component system response regulator GlrR
MSDEEQDIGPWKKAKREFEKKYLDTVLTCTAGNVSQAALIAEKGRKDFYQVMERNNIDPADYRT